MVIKSERDLTPAVIAAMGQTSEPRMRDILMALVKHLHAFVREVRLTEVEFREATAILNEIGQMQTDSHNEFVLMSGSLGVSSLVCLLNNGDKGQTETSQSLLGPFWRLNSPRVENGGTIIRSYTPGNPLFVHARVIDREGNPISGAEVDVWHASPVGLYENQDPDQAEMNLRGKFTTDGEATFLVPDSQDGWLSHPRRWSRRTHAQGSGPSSLSTSTFARADLQAGLQDADFAGFRSERSEYRIRRSVWRDCGTHRRFHSPRRTASNQPRHSGTVVLARLHLCHGSRRGSLAAPANQITLFGAG